MYLLPIAWITGVAKHLQDFLGYSPYSPGFILVQLVHTPGTGYVVQFILLLSSVPGTGYVVHDVTHDCFFIHFSQLIVLRLSSNQPYFQIDC